MGIKYKDGYKYQLYEDVKIQTEIKGEEVKEEFFILEKNGDLHVKRGYAWDGPSGPTIDTPKFVWASLPHDVFYQCMRHGWISRSRRKEVDQEMRRMLRTEPKPMNRFRAWYVYHVVRKGAGFAAQKPRPILEAP